MANTKARYCRVCTLLVFFLAVLLLPPLPAGAETAKTVRVGYFTLSDYNNVDENGQMHSYDAAYLAQAAKYADEDLSFTFVNCGTWTNAVKMLDAGTIDLVGTTQWNEEREEQYEYCLQNYGYTIGELVTLPENAVAYEDYAAISKMKIGVQTSYVHLKELKDCLAQNGCDAQLVYYSTYKSLETALTEGAVDAIASNSHMLLQDWVVIEKFSYDPLFFIARKGNTALTNALDDAFVRLNIEEPNFDDDTMQEYFPTINQNALTKEEKDYVSSLGSLAFCFCTNEGYLCRTEDGAYTGIHPAVAKRVCKMLGVEYKEVQFDFPKLIKGLAAVSDGGATSLVDEVRAMGIDVWGDFYYDQAWADTLGVGTTDPYLNASYYEIKKRGVLTDPTTCKVAAVQGLRYTADIVSSYAPDQIVWCDDFESCIKAVKEDRADVTVINTLAAEYYLSMFQYNSLNATLIEFSNQSSMAVVNDKDGLLVSALNKTLNSISESEMDDLIRTETAKAPKQNGLVAYFYTHTVMAILMIAAVVAVFMALLSMLIIILRSKRQNAKLVRATNAKSDFLARMSHDIRTPLNVIIGMSHLAQENDNPPDTQDCLQKIDISSEFLLGLVNDVLDMERIEKGSIELHPVPYKGEDFRQYIETVISPLCKEKDLQFIYTVDTQSSFTLLQDKLRINQIYFNLLSNAVKYTPEGGRISFHTKATTLPGDRIALDVTISDTGIGMSEEFQKHMFEAFTQENQIMTSVSQGSGLGLSIVKRLCEAMDISIAVKSALGQGTTYTLHGEFASVPNAPETAPQPSAAADKDSYPALNGKIILVCEDHMLNQEIVKRLLQKQGAIPIMMEDGKKGVDAFMQSSPGEYAAVLMDIRMPIMDGLAATRAIRAVDRPDAKTIPIIAMTANAYASDVEQTKAAGMNEHLAKPIDTKLLYSTLERYIKGK